MLRKNTFTGSVSDGPRHVRVDRPDQCRNMLTTVGEKNLAIRSKERFDSFPAVCNHASCRSGSLEDSGCGRKSIPRHAVPADIQHQTGRTVEGVVILRIDVSHIRYILWDRFITPAISAEQKLLFSRKPGGLEEILFHTRFPIGQTIAEE